MKKIKILIPLIILLCCSFRFDEKQVSYSNTYVVIVGIADYQNLSYNSGDLRYTINDCNKLSKFLMSEKGGSIPAKNIYTLTNSLAKKANIIKYSKKIFTNAKENDRVIFYYSGHGMAGAFLPYDIKQNGNSLLNVLYFDEIKEIFQAANCKTKLIFADACFSGSLKNTSKTVKKNIELKNINSKEFEIAVMLSCKENETSLELSDLKQGIFSYYLINGLGGSADLDKNKFVTIEELHKYVALKTKNKAKEQIDGNTKQPHNQNPITFGSFNKNMIVSKI